MTQPKVLVVDDSPTMRALLREVLEDELDAVVVESDNGFDALRELPQQQFDLVVTDINMPQINGLELLQFIRGNNAYRDVPVVIVTTENQMRDKQKGMALGASDYVLKPFDPGALAGTCRRLLEGSMR